MILFKSKTFLLSAVESCGLVMLDACDDVIMWHNVWWHQVDRNDLLLMKLSIICSTIRTCHELSHVRSLIHSEILLLNMFCVFIQKCRFSDCTNRILKCIFLLQSIKKASDKTDSLMKTSSQLLFSLLGSSQIYISFEEKAFYWFFMISSMKT